MTNTTSKQDKRIKELTWKYFWQRKRKEGAWAVGGITALAFIPYWVGLLMIKFWPAYVRWIIPEDYAIEIVDIWGLGLIFLLFVALALLVIGGALWFFMKSNYDAARYQAREEVTGEGWWSS